MIEEVINQYKGKIDNIIDNCLRVAEKEFKTHFDSPDLSFDLKSNNMTGSHVARQGVIKINPFYLKEYTDYILNQTVPHEVAHYIAYQYYGKVKSHGPEWKRIMRLFGLVPKRCHTNTLKDKPRKPRTRYRFIYVCNSCDKQFKLSSVKHKRISFLNFNYYYCRSCGRDSELKFTGKKIIL